MMFAIYRIDRQDVAGGRAEHREAHLSYLQPFLPSVLFAGALWASPDASGNRAEIGSLYLVDFENEEAARAFALNDPFHLAGLFESVDVRMFQIRVGTHKGVFDTITG